MKVLIFALILILGMPSLAFASSANQLTGLVIDARGYELKGDGSLQILDARGIIINSLVCVSPTWDVQNHNLFYYMENSQLPVSTGKSRAGSNYLSVKAIGLKNQGRSIVISIEDADKILKYREMRDVFEKGSIAIIN